MDFPAWDPVLFDLPGPIDIRWYGLMYIVGFVCAQFLMVRMARRGFFPVPADRAPDLILYCVLGVMLGGRIGYALFYDPDLRNPLQLLQVWKGGLAFHGGLLGVLVALVLFSRKAKVPWLRVADVCALAVTPGILAVRFANFINGELFGRVTTADSLLAMRFPTDPVALRQLGLAGDMVMRDRELCIQVACGRRSFDSVRESLAATDSLGRPVDWDAVAARLDWNAIADQVPYRYASQLYEMFFEGLVLGLLLLAVYKLTRGRPLPRGHYGAIFLLGYAAARICCEFVREPDSQFKTPDSPGGTVLLGMTMGQTLSAGMVLGGMLILLLSRKRDVLQPVPSAAENPER
jgi:phosphatidylglycerol:prolipoprotein diacylglycerol transferase